MVTKFTPDDFKFDLLEDAYLLRHHAMSVSPGRRPLDEDGAFWVITMDAWNDLRASADFINYANIGPPGRKELMGLPVRVTVYDEPDIPRIQLVMEPALHRNR